MTKKFSWGLSEIEEPPKGHHKVAPDGTSPSLAAPPMPDDDLVFLGTFLSKDNMRWESWYVKSIRRFDFVCSLRTFNLLEGTMADRVSKKVIADPTPEFKAWVTAVKLRLVTPTGVEPGQP